MTKLDMVRAIQDRTANLKITQVQVKAVLDALDEEMIDVIATGDSYVFKWASIRGIRKTARLGINPQNGNSIIWPEKITGKCIFGKAIKNLNNEEL